MTLNRVLLGNVIWSVTMLSAFAWLYVASPSDARQTLLLLSTANIGIAFLARQGQRWAIALSIAVATLLFLRWAPVVAINWWMFFTGHQLYRDSPGTILIVGIMTLLFALPATVLLVGYALNRHALAPLFLRTPGAPRVVDGGHDAA